MSEDREETRAETPSGPSPLRLAAWTLAIAWLFFAFAFFLHGERPTIELKSSDPVPYRFLYLWASNPVLPAWVGDIKAGWNGFPTEVLLQGLLLIWIALVAAILGRSFLRSLTSERSEVALLVWGSGLVLGLLGTVNFFLGIAGLWRHPRILFGTILLGLSLLALWLIKRERASNTKRPLVLFKWTKPEKVLLVPLLIIQGLVFLYALTPSTQSDALNYHLAAPQEWLKAGRLVYLPFNAFSNFPSTIEMLFLFGLGLGGDLLAKGFHFLFLPLSMGAVALLTNEIFLGFGTLRSGGKNQQETKTSSPNILGIRPSLWAAAIWGTLPLTVPLAGWGFIDLGVLFFTLGTVYFFFRWFRSRRAIHWILAGVFGGFLVASKYTGVLTVIYGASLMTLAGMLCTPSPNAPPSTFGRALSRAVAFGLIAAAFGAPWWIKNTIHTGNPVYPLAYGIFGGGGEWTETCDDIAKEKWKSKGEGHNLRAFLRLPWSTARHDGFFGGFTMGPFYWVFFPWIVVWSLLALIRFRSRPAPGLVVLWSLFFLLSWFFTYQSNRFLMPLLALATGMILTGLGEAIRQGRLSRALCTFILAALFIYNALYSTFWLVLDEGKMGRALTSGAPEYLNGVRAEDIPPEYLQLHPLVRWPAYTLGFISREEYLSDPAMKVAYYPIARYCNELLDKKSKILLVGEHRKMHWKGRVAGNDWYAPPLIQSYLAQAKDLDTLFEILASEGYTHVFFNLDEWGWWPTAPSPWPAWKDNRRHFTEKELVLLREFIESDRLVRITGLAPPARIYLCQIKKPQEPKK